MIEMQTVVLLVEKEILAIIMNLLIVINPKKKFIPKDFGMGVSC